MANNEQDQLWVHNPTKTEFTVKWGGYPYTLQSGEKKVMPRFIAEHFAKHLADAILLRKEQQWAEAHDGKMKPFVQHPVERPKIVNMILIGVYSYFQAPPGAESGAAAANLVEEMNRNPNQPAPDAPDDKTLYEDYGLVAPKAVGNLAAMPETADEPPANDGSLIDDVPPADDSTVTTEDPANQGTGAKSKRSREELLDEAERLGLTVKPKTPTFVIEKMIQNF